MLTRRELLRSAGAVTAAAVGTSAFPFAWAAPGRATATKTAKVLVFTRSQGFEHSVVKAGKDGKPSLVDRTMTELAAKHNFEVTCTKDGRIFLPETLREFDAFFFITTGDLTKEGGDKQPPMPPEGKKALLDAIAAGKGFVGSHCASDTFHSHADKNENTKWSNQSPEQMDPYIAMLGGEFIRHGPDQQEATMRVADPKFPGLSGLKDFRIKEEWYALKNFAPDLHVILVQETKGMKNYDYQRPDYPATWARKHGNGRVFYTSMGHREDVWESETFHQILVGGLSWALGRVDADLSPNLTAVTPRASEVPGVPPPNPPKKP
jgi:type 1 glutamine amidotransferase